MMVDFARVSTVVAALDRRKTAILKLFGLIVFAVVGLSSLAHSSAVAVGTCTNLPFYPTIQLAVNSVPAGTTIKICPGIYPEQVTISKNLTLAGVSANGAVGPTGSGADNPTIVSPAGGVVTNASDLFDGSPIAAQIVVATPSGAGQPILVSISNIIVDGSNNQIAGCAPDLVGIYYQNASGTLNRVVTRFQELGSGLGGCQSGLGIFAESGYGTGGTSVVTIANSSVHDYQKNGITVDGSGTTASVQLNYVVGQGATPVIAQNGIQLSDGATGTIANNTVTDDVYVNPPGGPYFSASGILLYDSGGSSAKAVVVSGNTVSNAQGAIVTFGDSLGTADYNSVTSNKITTSPAAGPFFIDGIDLCSNNNTARSNTVFNSSGAGVHIDSQCTESTGPSGSGTTVASNSINEACAGVLTGTGTGNSVSNNSAYNVVQILQSGDSCPSGSGTAKKRNVKLIPHPLHR